MSEIIYRQDAVKALYRRFPTKTMEECAMMLQEVPSAEPDVPDRNVGKWIKQDCSGVEYTAVCSECGYGTFWSDASDFNFCPNCGADMRGELDEVDRCRRL